jgi:hypothetical protein
MKKFSENFAPYTSIGNMLMVLKRIRNGWLPSHVDSEEIQRVGVTKGNASRTIITLQFLELLDENEATTELWKAIATASANEYPEILADILTNSYVSIFELHPVPSEATDIDIDNAFRKMEPLGQKARMISLFRGLCQEANLIAGDPLTRSRKSKQVSREKGEESAEIPSKDAIRATKFRTPEKINPSLVWYNYLETLIGVLPDPENPRWTSSERDKWLNALRYMLELLIDIDSEEEDDIQF